MSPKKSSSWILWVVILVLIGGGAAWGWKKYNNAEKPVEFKTAEVARGEIVQAVTANGQILPVKNVQVGSQVSGIITDIYVDFNSKVTNNQVIARIDPSTYQQNITLAEAELQNAQAALEYAQLNYNRAKDLRAAELVSASDYDKTVADLHQAQAVVKTREASLNKAKVDLERTTIYAPDDGVVISRAVDVGQTVAASFNTPTLFQIAHDLREMRIEAMVSEADVGGVSEGQPVKFTVDAFPNRQFSGKVSQVRFAPVTNQNVVNYTAVVAVKNDDLKLRPGMTATASIITAERKDALKIPNAALRFRPTDEMLGVKPEKPGRNVKDSAAPVGNVAEAKPAAGPQGGGGGSGGSSADGEERRRRWQSMTPEQREQFRAMRGQGGSSFGGGAGSHASEGPVTRTVYVATQATGENEPKVKAVKIKTGISDGNFTEVLEGLNEGDKIVTGLASSAGAPLAAGQQQRSPFGGPFGGGSRRR
jgi:HlyD family secretion protein